MSTDLVQAGGALAIRPDQTDWTPAQQAVLQQSGIDNQVTAAELSAFLHLCQRTRLDPFSRQIYLIGRWDSRQQRKVYTPQTSIDGYRVIAHRVVAEQNADLGYEDTLWCDKDGQWRDVWLSETPPSGVKVTVIRNGQRFPAVALFREYVQTGKENKSIGLWGKMPAGQLAKCAEALALRKAFPHDLAGVYTAEEMAQADNPAPEERHLRSIQQGEADPWATPVTAPQQTTEAPPVEPHRPAQEIADQAEKATAKERISELWGLAKTGRLMEAPVLAADTSQISELGQYLTRRAKAITEPRPTGAEGHDEGVVDAEVVPDGDADHAAAVAELRAAAEAANLSDFENGAYSALGCSLEDASANAIRTLAAQIRPAA
jgi:phage recombination protein Bet